VTAGDSLAGRLAALVDDDTEGCLCLVAGYAKKDGLIASVTAEAERRVMMSPALGDFLQLRYVDLGPQPDWADDRSGTVRRIVADLMAVRETTGRSHFALVVIARSAMTVEGLLASCAAEPFLAGLRMRLAGIAGTDDRERENGFADITSSPEGSWRNERELVDALRQRCEELPRYFAERGEPGLTRADLAALRRAHDQPAVDGDGPEGAAPDEAPAPDVLADAHPAADQDAAPAGRAPAGAAAGRLAASIPRWRPAVPWRHGPQAAKADDPGAAAPTGPARTAMGLVYLLTIVDQYAAADPALGRLQAALLDVDRRLAAPSLCGYQVRVIHGSDGGLRGELQDAGGLGRRAAKRSVKTGDFTAVLQGIRGFLRRDRGLVQAAAAAAGLTVTPPTVVIFTTDPPMADLSAATVFSDLAAEATLVWVVPKKLESLVSPAFGSACGAVVLGEHQTVADEILDVMPGGVFAS
jgi:hypothetical protein